EDGKYLLRLFLIATAILSKSALSLGSDLPGNPPPTSRRVILNPNCCAHSKTFLESLMAPSYAFSERHPEPTWKLTAITVSPSCFAISRRWGACSTLAPNLAPNLYLDSES